MNVTKSAPYFDTLEEGKVLTVTVTGGSAILEFFIGGTSLLKAVANTTLTFGPYATNVEIIVTNISGIINASKSNPIRQMATLVTDASNNVTGIINPGSGATIPFPVAGYSPSAVAITGGTINGATIGQTTPAAVNTSNLQLTFTDSTGTPGNVTNNSPRGKVSFAAGSSIVVVTNSLVTTSSSVIADLNVADGALNAIVSCVAGNGTITITGNAAATTSGLARSDFIVFN